MDKEGRDWVDTGLGIAAGFDWISPMLGFMGDLLNGGGHGFVIDWNSCPMSGYDVRRLLKKRGIKAWGLMTVGDKLLVSVPKHKAAWASHLLESAGVPVENPVGGGQGATVARATRTRTSDIGRRSRILQRMRGGRR